MSGFFRKPLKRIFGTNGKQGSNNFDMPLYGNLADRSLVEILGYCEKSFLNGRVVVRHGAQSGSFLYVDGRLQKAILDNLPEDEAFDRMLDWTAGQYEIRPTAVMQNPVSEPDGRHAGTGRHILILSFNKLQRKLVERALAAQGHFTYLIDSPLTTVKMLRTTDPDLMIFDTSLPESTLVDMIKTVREISGVTIVLVCEENERNYLQGIARSYPNIYLTNSAGPEEVLRVANVILSPEDDGFGLW
ncbi:MAG: DUF4388 domain-containing protein [Calditrichaeota bacterium]|nr:DUF4388 domain-containing protein [Calditrichota bacterium]HQU74139.1 DUF4388 domain-containing protein [Calditrichia bacterium]